MSLGHHSDMIPEHSLQSLWPGLTQSVLQTWNATCWGSCQLQSWCGDECECKSDPWHRVLLLVLCYTATRLLLLQNTSDPWHSVQLLVLCVYLPEWFWSGRFAVGGPSGNTTELHPQWRVQSLFRPSACFWGNANLYLSTAFCIRLNSSKIHSSNNNIPTCTAPFILLHSLQLRDTACLSASSASHSTPSQLWVFHKLYTQSAGTPPTGIGSSQDQRIQHRDLVDLY